MSECIDSAQDLLETAQRHLSTAVDTLASSTRSAEGRVDQQALDAHQVDLVDVAQVACLVGAGQSLARRAAAGTAGPDGDSLALGFAGYVAGEVLSKSAGRQTLWGNGVEFPASALAAARDTELLTAIARRLPTQGYRDLPIGEDLDTARTVFREFGRDRIEPFAEALHRHDQDIPDAVIDELAAMGFFGMGIPEEYGGSSTGGDSAHSHHDLLAMLVATEEITRASMGLAGPFVTRPEILATALMKGGDAAQAKRWLPDVAAGAKMVAVAVTEPGYGSDAANLTVRAVRDGDHYVIKGVKTWSTFSGRAELLLVMARTGTVQQRHKGLSLFVVEKPAFTGHTWTWDSPHGGRLEAQAIPTIGYRGMHSFEISFDDLRVPADCLIGGDDALGRGFYLQMNAFANGRTQTAARGVGLMKAALGAAFRYSHERAVFGRILFDYQLTQWKLGMMACHAAACQAYAYDVADLLAAGGGQLEASMVKSVACRSAEWVTREAQQLHGGYGYAEEYPVSRYFLDARVLALFEGADETLALRVIGRGLVERAPAR